jgi:hypothetical protein
MCAILGWLYGDLLIYDWPLWPLEYALTHCA